MWKFIQCFVIELINSDFARFVSQPKYVVTFLMFSQIFLDLILVTLKHIQFSGQERGKRLRVIILCHIANFAGLFFAQPQPTWWRCWFTEESRNRGMEWLWESFPLSPPPHLRLFGFMGPSLKCTAEKREVHFPMCSRTSKQASE